MPQRCDGLAIGPKQKSIYGLVAPTRREIKPTTFSCAALSICIPSVYRKKAPPGHQFNSPRHKNQSPRLQLSYPFRTVPKKPAGPPLVTLHPSSFLPQLLFRHHHLSAPHFSEGIRTQKKTKPTSINHRQDDHECPHCNRTHDQHGILQEPLPEARRERRFFGSPRAEVCSLRLEVWEDWRDMVRAEVRGRGGQKWGRRRCCRHFSVGRVR